ncbi:sigma-70 family RNA polymerase sigma factor [Nocardia sp. BMG51109]|uniref:sigma-70 family RNA polymerase sigma factor n=1 Tax=Nocardia sp. BMG51109 TaxID=1056816 RepID=UPI000465E29F
MGFVEKFEAARPRLLSLAHRIVGSQHDAEDAVQTAWLRVQSADPAAVVNPDGLFTTVTARICFDHLRGRERRAELPLLPSDIPGEQLAADEEFLRRDEVSRALLVLLGELSPKQRVAFVLHDLFAVPFDQVAAVLDTTPATAKKLASRARIRLREADPAEPDRSAEHFEIIDAFLAAARGGDIARLVSLMAPGVVRTADPALLPQGGRTTVRGATEVAEETRAFVDRITAAVPLLVGGHPGAVIAPGGHPFALIRFRIDRGLIAGIDIAPCVPGTLLPAAPG